MSLISSVYSRARASDEYVCDERAIDARANVVHAHGDCASYEHGYVLVYVNVHDHDRVSSQRAHRAGRCGGYA